THSFTHCLPPRHRPAKFPFLPRTDVTCVRLPIHSFTHSLTHSLSLCLPATGPGIYPFCPIQVFHIAVTPFTHSLTHSFTHCLSSATKKLSIFASTHELYHPPFLQPTRP